MKDPSKLNAVGIQAKHHCLFLQYRNQDRIIQSEAFAEAWSQANEKQRKFALNCIKGPNSDGIKKWILSILRGGLDQYTTQVLRQIGSYNHVKNYSRMTKLQLLDALSEKGITNDSSNDRS